jgi:hypothetical protein
MGPIVLSWYVSSINDSIHSSIGFGVHRLSGVPESPHFPILVDKLMPSFKGNLGILGSLAWEYVRYPANN